MTGHAASKLSRNHPDELRRPRSVTPGLDLTGCQPPAYALEVDQGYVNQADSPAARQDKVARKQQNTPAVRNVTDPGSRLISVRDDGFIQGYNAQNVASEDGLVIATRLTPTGSVNRAYSGASLMRAHAERRRPASGTHV